MVDFMSNDRREYHHQYYQAHRDRMITQSRESAARNRPARLARLRERREQDPEFRQSMQQRQRTFRDKVREGHEPAVEPLYRTINGELVRVYRASEASRLIGCSECTIKSWQRGGWIPDSQFQGRPVYTAHQIDLMREYFLIPISDRVMRSKVSKITFDSWAK